MEREKIDYGIDLGTTNSAIARMENGEVKIIKSDKAKRKTQLPLVIISERTQNLDVGDTANATR